LFMIDRSGRVASTWWEASKNWQPWFAVNPGTGKMAPPQTVTAIWNFSRQHLDLFATTTLGTVASTWWEAPKGWQQWFQIQTASGQTASHEQVSAAWSNPNHLDLFIVDHNGRIASTWWEASKNWQPWFSIYPDAAMDRLLDTRNVVTQLHDNARIGASLDETQLTPETLAGAGFGKLYQRRVEGQMLAQPLCLRQVPTRRGVKNLILAATAANMVYAFDADNTSGGPDDGVVFSRKAP